MSLKYGLNVKKAAPPPVRKTILDEDDEDGPDDELLGAEEISTFGHGDGTAKPRSTSDGLKPTSRPLLVQKKDEEDRTDLSSIQAARAHVKAAEEVDASIFDYDSFHDAKASVTESKKAAARQDAIERKPKYINNLLDAAAQRKQDQLIAREKLLQKEREAEGDEFADKEKFVTGAYKVQQEEARKAEEEEKKKAGSGEKQRQKLGGGMQGFYKSMIDQREQNHQEAVEAAAKLELDGKVRPVHDKQEKSDADLAAEMKAKGFNVNLNEDGQVTDKRELLSAGLNVAGSGKAGSRGADHLRASARPAQSPFARKGNAGREGQRERQTRMIEEQIAAQAKREREEEEEEQQKQERAAKSTKTEKDIGDAKARYLARKAAKERGEG